MSDFNSTEFAVGSAVGIRVWRPDSLGRLTGWTHRQVWTPGENIAVCKKVDAWQRSQITGAWYMYDEEAPKPPEPCKEVTPDCGCGFWAYHSGTPEFGDSEGVVGICEGYGVTTIGTKGFRASKARVLALAFPKSSCGCTHDLRFAQSSGVEALVRRNYPDVAYFESVDAMLAEFPPDKPELPGPDSPEFWTMPDPSSDDCRMMPRFNLGAWVPTANRTWGSPATTSVSSYRETRERVLKELEASKPSRRWFR